MYCAGGVMRGGIGASTGFWSTAGVLGWTGVSSSVGTLSSGDVSSSSGMLCSSGMLSSGVVCGAGACADNLRGVKAIAATASMVSIVVSLVITVLSSRRGMRIALSI